MLVNKLVLFIIFLLVFKVNASEEITNLTKFSHVKTFKSTPYSYYDYTVNEKSGQLVYVYCDAVDSSQPREKYMSCNVTVEAVFSDPARNKTCKADFTSEPRDELEILNKYHVHRHKVAILNSDKVLLIKNSLRHEEPNTMELLIVRMSDCSVKSVTTETQLEPYVYAEKYFFYVLFFEQDDSRGNNDTFVKLITYNENAEVFWRPNWMFFSDPTWIKNYFFIDPVWIGSSNEVSYLHVFYCNLKGHAYHSVYQSGLDGTIRLIKTKNLIMGTSRLGTTSSFCWLRGQNTISCKQYNSKGKLRLSVKENFFDDSIPWETEMPGLREQKPGRSRQLKLHSLQDGGLLLVAVNKISRNSGLNLDVKIESFDVVSIDQHTGNYSAPKNIQIDDGDFQSVKLIVPRSAENVYSPRVNVFENSEKVCLAFWHDPKETESDSYSKTVKFTGKCFSKTYLSGVNGV